MTGRLKTYQLKPDVVFQQMDDEAIIVSLNSEEIFKLNLTGTEVVKLIETKIPMAEVLTQLALRFDLEQHDLARDVNDLLDQLLKAGLIEEITPS